MSTTGIAPTLIHSLPSLHHLSRVLAVPHIQATTPARYQAQDTQVHHHTHLTHIAPAMQPMDQTHHLSALNHSQETTTMVVEIGDIVTIMIDIETILEMRSMRYSRSNSHMLLR